MTYYKLQKKNKTKKQQQQQQQQKQNKKKKKKKKTLCLCKLILNVIKWRRKYQGKIQDTHPTQCAWGEWHEMTRHIGIANTELFLSQMAN